MTKVSTKIPKYSGLVERVLFSDSEKSFYILAMLLGEDGVRQTVTGTIVGLTVTKGIRFSFRARRQKHPKYGPQLQIIGNAPLPPEEWTDKEILSFFTGKSSRTSPGLGSLLDDVLEVPDQPHSFLAHHLTRAFPEGGFAKALQDKDLLAKKVGEDIAEGLLSVWNDFSGLFSCHQFLADLGLKIPHIKAVWEAYGADTQMVVNTDPWKLCKFGVRHSTADKIAEKVGIPSGDPRRVAAALLYALRKQKGEGHLYSLATPLIAFALQSCPEATKDDLKKGLTAASRDKEIIKDADDQGRPILYERSAFRYEDESAKFLAERKKNAKSSIAPKPKESYEAFRLRMRRWVKKWAEPLSIDLTDTQADGVVHALHAPVSILTGLPGTGKTTTLRVLVKILQEEGINFSLMAPTGIAAKRMKQVTGAEATTIHRAFRARGKGSYRQASYVGVEDGSEKVLDEVLGTNSDFGWEDIGPSMEVIIIDECSMLDQTVLHKVLKYSPDTCRLVFVGDAAQLPSVGPGKTLQEMIDSGEFPVTQLHEIFRQANTSGIVFAAHDIFHGKVPQSMKDFEIVTCRKDQEVQDKVVEEAIRLFSQRSNFQVLSPRHMGVIGVTELNRRLRAALNPTHAGARELKIGDDVIREGDRVMICRNNYAKQVFNGDVGTVISIEHTKGGEGLVRVKIHGPDPEIVELEKKEATDLLRLAYAITVHKSQGQEYGTIVMPWTLSMSRQLQRTLLYTAITRAKSRVVLVGHPSAVARAVANSSQMMRCTMLAHRIRGYVHGTR